jgi:plasmid stability protein
LIRNRRSKRSSVPSIQIKNVPEDVHRMLRRRAAEAGMSLQEYLLARLTEDARQPTLEEIFARIGTGERTGGRLDPDDAVRFLRDDRDSH